MRVVIVGAGIMGTAIARDLAAHGAHVTLIEKAIVGAEASSAAAGMLAPQLEATGPGPLLELSLRSRGLYPAWAEQLSAESGVDVGYLASGALQLAFTEARAHELEATVAWQQAFGLRATLLSDAELKALEPAVAPRALTAAHFPDDHQIDPRRLMEALSRSVRRAGVEVRAQLVRRVLERAGAVIGVELEGGFVEADLTIVAAGAWTAQIEGIGLTPTQIGPVKGQLLELVCPGGRAPVSHVLKSGLDYVVPRADGSVVCGTTVEHVGFDKQVTEQGVEQVRRGALALCPALEAATQRAAWAGFRPWTHDGLPLLGELRPGLVIASGHFRNGILLAPITAKVVGQLVRGQPTSVPLAPLSPARAAR